MSANVLMNLLKELVKRNKMQGLPSIISFFSLSSINSLNRSTNIRFNLSYMGLDARKPVFGGLRTTKAQTSLCICAV